MLIQLFDGVGAVSDDGEPLDVGPAKCQAVIAALALSPGRAVPVGRLVELVWGVAPPRTAERTLQSYVTRLRKGLGANKIVRTGAAYRLDIPTDAVDVARFQRLLDAGELEAALAEWTGPPLAGLDAPGLAATVDALVERWLNAVESDLERRIESDPPAAIGALTELTAGHPFREGLWALLMTALYRVGRQADALAAYRAARQHLVEHLGVEPGPRLRELEALILNHDEHLGVVRSPTGPASGRPTGTVTFGFLEVEDSTRWWASHRQEMDAAMARHDAIVRAVSGEHGGYVFATGGDGFGVAFHRASEGAQWAAALQAAVQREPWSGGVEIRLRIALHTGEPEDRANGYVGRPVNVAARLAEVGHGRQTLVSDATAALLDGADLRDLGTYRLEGIVAEQRILQVDDGDHPPLRAEPTRSGNLPRPVGRLVGRDGDLAIVEDAVARHHVVTLVGPGGIGKTRLALAAARNAGGADGAWLIDLADVASPTEVSGSVARVLGIRARSTRTAIDSVIAALETRRSLLVLDGCEHVVAAAAEVVQAIAGGCPSVRVLATSRQGLGLREEKLIAVPPLETAAGVELFNERATAAARGFDPDASRDDVEEICRRLDGVPLAIELAAARTKTLAPADLVERLDDRLRLLTGGPRSGVERHRTLRAAVQWSYDLLTPREQLLFDRLSVFAGSFDLAAAEAVVADAELDVAEVVSLLDDLVERSMVIVEPGPLGRRFQLLETRRLFAAEHLRARGDADEFASRHAQWCGRRVEAVQQMLATAGGNDREGETRLEELWPNIAAAFDWARGSRNGAAAAYVALLTDAANELAPGTVDGDPLHSLRAAIDREAGNGDRTSSRPRVS